MNANFSRWRLALALLLLLPAASALATVCHNQKGVATDVFYDLTDTFTSANNQPGQVVTLSNKSGWVGVEAVCPSGTTGQTTMRSYVTDFPITSTDGKFKYLKLNDYLDGAMQISDSYACTFWPPQNYIQMGRHGNVPNVQPFPVEDSNLVFRLKVTRRFINMVVIPKQTMFRVYVTTTSNDPLSTPVYTISYSGIINVPQNCAINAGTLVDFDFGDIGAALFSKAGAGNRPDGVAVKQKTIGIKCTNVENQATLSMRIEAEQAQGTMMVSDNPDVGFIVADSSGSPLTPNTLGSKIPFRLDANAQAQVSIRAWPVSITGKKPAEGAFVARGYLRVDYD